MKPRIEQSRPKKRNSTMATIIAVTNHKGGVGKTTTTATLGAALAEMGKNVLLVDLDAQSNLTGSLSKQEPTRSVYDAIMEGKNLPIVKVDKNLSIVPSSIDMAGVELQISGKVSREYLLKDLLEPIADNYSYILLDCPPSLGLITLNALVAANGIIVPMTAEALPTKGLQMLTDFVEQVKKRPNPSLALYGIVLTRWKGCNLNSEVEAAVKRAFGESAIFETRIRENITVAEAPLYAMSLLEYDSKCNGSKDYIALALELEGRLNGKRK